jgi:hypothetical protein
MKRKLQGAIAAAVVVVCAASACADDAKTTTPEMGKWTRVEKTSRMDDTTTVLYHLEANSPLEGWLGVTKQPILAVRCDKDDLLAVIIMGLPPDSTPPAKHATMLRRMKGGGDTTTLRVRFGTDKAEAMRVEPMTRDDGTYSLADAKRMVEKMASHDTLLVEFQPFKAATQQAEFDVRGTAGLLSSLPCH